MSPKQHQNDGSRSNAHAHPLRQSESFDDLGGPVSRVKSTSSLMPSQKAFHDPRPRMSFDGLADQPSMTASERDNGLRRIRQVPSARVPSGSHTNRTSCRASSLNLSIPHHASINTPSGPPSPLCVTSEDLTRFPQESLHSFSFAHQSEVSLHNRQNVLKRSIDFMKDRIGWASSNPAIVDAHARVTGDQEVQSMMELLQRANLLGAAGAAGSGLGPLTGPPDNSAENVFEKNFIPPVDGSKEKDTSVETLQCDSPDELSPTNTEPHQASVSDESHEKPGPSPLLGRRSQLKRTFTDVEGYSLQNKLADVLAQPYMAAESGPRSNLLSPKFAPTMNEPPKRNMTISPSGAPHSHATRQNAAAQAIFTTEDHAPWTVTAANDLACLVFGVTKAEVRKMGILEVIRPEQRKWLESKLRPAQPDMHGSRPNAQLQNKSPSPSPSRGMGNGVTAKLLSKPPARQTYQSRRSRTEGGSADGNGSALSRSNSATRKSRGVLLCGDVVPIQKRNGAVGSASLWVKEKQGSLIWVLEEIAEDIATISIDEVGCIVRGSGAIEAIFGIERVRRGMDVRKLLPELPKQRGTHTGALDYEQISQTRRYTARTSNSINIPVTVDILPDEPTFQVSSFPHIAGIMVLSSETLKVTSSNSVFSAALFGHENPDGLHVTQMIPLFDELLSLISDEDSIEFKDGIVIPEHSFRRARALLAVRHGRADAASIFLRPSGLPAQHRDGSEIMVDVQMRVVKSESQGPFPGDTILEEEDGQGDPKDGAAPAVSYALWITYSRQVHAANHGIGPVAPLIMSRPGTPPHQPSPGQPTPASSEMETDDSSVEDTTSTSIQQQIQEASSQPMVTAVESELYEHPSPAALAAGAQVTKKKKISDFVILEEMGKGAYGEVKLVRYRKPNAHKMVVKYVTKRRILVDTWTRDRRLGTVPLEIHVLDYLRRDGHQHPNVIEMADFFEDDINYYIEMVPHGLPGVDLFDYIELRVNMEERECRQIFVQVANALHHLHIKARVVHRDIKDENVILDGEGRVKVVDFGSAAYIKSGPFDVFVGTIDYAAPEVLRGLPYRGKEQDVWALGILLYTIVYKENPFYSIDEIMDHDLRVPYVMSEDCLDLIRKMLDRDVERRIGIQDVLDHPWSTYIDSDDD